MRGDNGSCGEYIEKKTSLHCCSAPEAVGKQTAAAAEKSRIVFVTDSPHEELLPEKYSQVIENCTYHHQPKWFIPLAGKILLSYWKVGAEAFYYFKSHSHKGPSDQQGSTGGVIITDKRRIHRLCGFLAFLFTLFLVLSSVLETEVEVVPSPLYASTSVFGVFRALDSNNNNNDQRGESTTFKFHSASPSESLPSSTKSFTVKIKRLPQSIIIGARKCGTRALIDMLNLHPQVEKAPVEVHFFDRDGNYAKGLDWYQQQMPEVREDQIAIEKSPSYFVTPEVPERIHGMNNSIKLLLIVREPVTRVISDYTQIYGINSKSSNGSKNPKLEELVLQSDGSINVHYKAVRISIYSRYIQRWLDVFPPSQIHVVDGDALIRDPYPQLKDVERFLGLHPRLVRDNFYFNATKGFYCWRRLDLDTKNETGLHCLNDSKGRKHPPVNRNVVSKLRRFYYPHNLKFYEMVGRDFGWPVK